MGTTSRKSTTKGERRLYRRDALLAQTLTYRRVRSRGKWFLFDDETVTPIDDLNSPTVHDEDGAPVTSKKRPAAGFVRGADGNMYGQSVLRIASAEMY